MLITWSDGLWRWREANGCRFYIRLADELDVGSEGKRGIMRNF